MKKTTKALVFSASIALAVTGCAGTPTGGSNSANGSGTGELASVPGYDAATKTITVGSMVPVSGIWEGATANVKGEEAYYHRATQPGGLLEGYKVVVKNQDTQYNPSVAVPLYNSSKNDVLMYSMVLGSGINNALHEQYLADDMLVIAASNESGIVRDPNMLSAGPLYGTYVASGVEYMATEQGENDGTYCALLQDDHLGEQVKDGFEFSTKSLGLKVGVTASFPAGNADFTPQVSQLKQANCSVVVIGGAGSVIQNAAVKAVALNFDAKWLAPNFAYNEKIATGPANEYLKKNTTFMVTGTEWGDDTVEGQKNLEADLEAVAPGSKPVANAYQSGYTNAMIATKVIAQGIADKDLSRKHLLEIAQTKLATISDQGLLGGDIVYGSSLKDRTPNSTVSMFSISADSPTGLKLKKKFFESEVAAKYNEDAMSKVTN